MHDPLSQQWHFNMEQWNKLIEWAKEHPYAEIKIIVKGGVPVMIEQAVENIKLA